MRVTYDPEVDAAYIYCTDAKPRGRIAHSVHLAGELLGVHVDLDSSGRILGIEVLEATDLLPSDLLAKAERPTGSRVSE